MSTGPAERDLLQLETVTGEGIRNALGPVARLRIAVFREWPYLYAGDPAYEERYLEAFSRAPGAAVVLARAAGRIVGAATALPLAEADPVFGDAFRRAGSPVEDVCYFGESVLETVWRGQGIGRRFFELRERHTAAMGLAVTSFCAVVRDDDDPRRPPDHRALDPFWRRLGYAPDPALHCELAWQEAGATEETAHRMQFWRRDLPRNA